MKIAQDELVETQRRLVESESDVENLVLSSRQNMKQMLSNQEQMFESKMLEMRKRLKQSEDEHMLSNVERSESRNEIENQLRRDLKIAQDEMFETQRRLVESESDVESYVLSSREDMKQMLSEREQMMESKMHAELLEMRLKESENEVKTQMLSNVEKSNNQLRHDLKIARDEVVETRRRLEESLSYEQISSNQLEQMLEMQKRLKESEDDVKRLVLSNVEKSESQS